MASVSALSNAEIILASASPSRSALLENAGINFRKIPAHVDEDEIKRSLAAENASAMHVAETLAELKAQRVSQQYPDMLVIGADQMLECEGQWFDKPADLNSAADSLRQLQGKTHFLLSALCVVRGGQVLWHHNAKTKMMMRPLSDTFILNYLAAVGEKVCTSVGAYQLEGLGAHLFDEVDGDYFTILGLSLLPLLAFLREHEVIAS